MRSAGLILTFLIKVFSWLPVAFIVLFLLRLNVLFGEAAKDILQTIWDIIKVSMEIFR